ncbi:T9SS type A sorting domain-containing protein [Candidatus Sulfidibacterium hydrothermale]|uniref:T9SS type A sorting domain-containing protein n=1 Tax=Candidatus Sulfidibacterium hydrothermale TaxID=2875962 RepID=UPI001F0A6D0E|nr:T9SS type A sorting domain-containing protein [Candidatus Sulfidibacterium hydrothermale]UBM61582.1 T9SS type A sorting domain-containing protein [Candidatus Sulfidibacterium hydrothermale]
MENRPLHKKRKPFIPFSIYLLFFILGLGNFFTAKAQTPIDSLIFATDGTVESTVISGDYLYLGGDFTHIGEKTGPIAFFLNGSNTPEKGMPIVGDIRPYWMSDQVYTVLPDDNGGWFIAGKFSLINNREHNIFAHILKDKSIDPLWDLKWESDKQINVMKYDGDYIYLAGDMSIKDSQGNLHEYVCRINRKTREVDPEWNPDLKDADEVEKMEIGKDWVYLAGWIGKVEGFWQDAMVVVDKNTGKRIAFPTASSITALKLMGDTLLAGQPNLYWSKYPDGFGYIAKGIVGLDEQNDKPVQADAPEGYFYHSIPDGNGGWYVAGRYNENDGFFHLDKDLQEIETFKQDNLTYSSPYTRLLLYNNALFIGTKSDISLNEKTYRYLFKLDATTGEMDTSFRPLPNAQIYSLAQWGDTLIVGGKFDTIAGEYRPGLAAIDLKTGALLPWKPDIHLSNFDAGYTGGERAIQAMTIKNDTLYIGGIFQISTPTLDSNARGIYGLARYNLKTGELDTTFHIHTSYFDQPTITGMDFLNNDLYVVGIFDIKTPSGEEIENTAIFNIAKRQLSPVNTGFLFSHSDSFSIPQILIQNGIIYMWGISATDNSTGEKRSYFISLKASDHQFTSWNPLPNYRVHSFSFSNDKILMSGNFYFLKSYPDNFVGITIPNGNYVQFPDLESAYTLALSPKYIFIGGDFKWYNDSSVNGLVRLKRKDLSFTSFPHHILSDQKPIAINSIVLGDSGLYVTGYSAFNLVNGNYRQNICLLDPETAELKNWQPPTADDKPERVFCFGNNVVVAGGFGLMPSWERNGAAKINLKTSSVTDWNMNIPGYIHIYKIIVAGDTVYVGGDDIDEINGKDASELSAVSASSATLISGFKPSILTDGYGDSEITAMAKYGNALYAAGEFFSVNGKTHHCIVKLDASTGEVQNWDPKLYEGWNPIYCILPTDTAVYIGGKEINTENNNDVKSWLIKVDTDSGNLKKIYPSSYNQKIRALALNKDGVLAAASNDYKGLLILDKTKDTLLPVESQPEFYWGLYQVTAIDNGFIALGNKIKEFNSYTEKPGLFIYDLNLDTVANIISIPVIQGHPYHFALNGTLLTLGGDFDGINEQITNSNIDFLTMPTQIMLEPGVYSWSPKRANNTDPFALTINGYGFSDSTIVRLYGYQNWYPDSMSVTPEKIIAWFDGKKIFTPQYLNLAVKLNNNSDEEIFTKAVTLTTTLPSDVWADWVGPSKVLAGKPTTFYLLYGNRSTANAYGVFLYLAVEDKQSIILPNDIQPPATDGINWDTIPSYVESDYFLGEPFKGKVYTISLPYLPAEYEGAIKLTVNSATSSNPIRVGISRPIYNSYEELTSTGTKSANGIGYSFFSCMYSIADFFADLTPGISCMKAAFDNTVLMAIDKHVQNESVQAEDIANALGMTILGCIPGEAAVSKGFAIAKGMASMYSNASGVSSALGACGGFIDGLKKEAFDVEGYVTHDPNAKFGPEGMNTSPYIRSDHPYNYIVTFENDSGATAPVQRVIITDTLDKNVFDLNTFKAIGFGFGDTSYMFRPTDGDTVYIDLRPEKNTIVRVFYQLDKNSGILTWNFMALDPETYQLVDNIDDGFLPPNRKAPEGEGNILYAVTPLSGLPEGTQIKNAAHIVFDWNDEIPTNTWNNTTDNIAPESAVNALPDKTVETSFKVSWKGSDEGSGIYAYTVFVSENDSAYYPWLVDTHDTSAVFSGQPGVTYKFYSIAVDSAGNKEPVPSIYDAKITVSGTGIETFGTGNQMQFRIYPNPAKEHFNVDYYLPESSSVRIDVLNACGHLVQLPVKTTALRGTSHVSLDISHLPAGYYFVRILTKYGVQVRKIIKQ